MRDKPWVMRTYSGHSSAQSSNELYRTNLAKGQTGLSIAFDLPTQMGYDSDHPRAEGEVGEVVLSVRGLTLEGVFENVSFVLRRERKHTDALPLALGLHKEFPNNGIFHRYVGRCYAALGNWEEMRGVFGDVLARPPRRSPRRRARSRRS